MKNSLRFSASVSSQWYNAVERECEAALQDTETMEKLKSHEYNLVIVEGSPLFQCYYAIPYKLRVPYVSYATYWPSMRLMSPDTLTSVPQYDFYAPGSMGVWDRLKNCFVYVLGNLYYFYPDGSLVGEYIQDRQYFTYQELASRSELWLLLNDHIVGYTRPFPPNVIPMVSIITRPAQKLSRELQKFANGASEGLIVMSLGSWLGHLPTETTTKFFEAFAKIPLRVIWKYDGVVPESTPPNVKLMHWIPQNDLLAHKNTALFISHCGINGLTEALYNGVPILGFPIFLDQPHNANTVKTKNYGSIMDISDFTTEELIQTIRHTIINPRIRQKVALASRIYHRSANETRRHVVDVLEEVGEFGGSHLRSLDIHLEWYEYMMLDVIMVFLAIASLIVYAFCWTVIWAHEKLRTRETVYTYDPDKIKFI